jgi:quinol monooxygenase YgiN
MKTSLLFISLCLAAFICSCGKQKTSETPLADTATVANECNLRIIHAGVFLKPEKVADFMEAVKAMIDSSNMEPGCISYQLFQDPYDETKFIFVEVWKDQAAIDAHFKMPYFTAWGPKTADWMAKPAELKIFNADAQD